jgi:glycosyltransferase involved in cell wall biosynthesis
LPALLAAFELFGFKDSAFVSNAADEVFEDSLALEIIIVDDCSSNQSLSIAHELAARHQGIRVLAHAQNMGKGAAISSGIAGNRAARACASAI